MIFECLNNGMLESNCYLVGNNGEGVIIDAGVNTDDVISVVTKHGLKIKYIILTHVHIDHIYYLESLKEKTGAQVLMHRDDYENLKSPLYNCSFFFGESLILNDPDRYVSDGETIDLAGLTLEIIHTPGHTPGGICIKVEDKLFTGDTLFRLSIGRTDLGRGDMDDLLNSVRKKLMILPDDTVVYPGHNDSSTIGFEKKNNMYLK